MPTILVADDNSNIQKMVALAFKGEGIDVVTVGNGEAAIKKASEVMPDLVLADIFMPVRGGYEVCDYLKHNTRFAHIPVVLLAGAFDPFDEREAQRVGADGVLKKPFVPTDPLVNLVKSLLARSDSTQTVSVSAPFAAAPVAEISSAPELSVVPARAAQPPAAATFHEFSSEMDERPAVKDFSLSPSQLGSDHAGGADPFGATLSGHQESQTEAISNHPLEHDQFQQQSSPAIEKAPSWFGHPAIFNQPALDDEALASLKENPAEAPPEKSLAGRGWAIQPSEGSQAEEETIVEPFDRFYTVSQSGTSPAKIDKELAPKISTPAPPVTAFSTEVSEDDAELGSSFIAREEMPIAAEELAPVEEWRPAFPVVPVQEAQILDHTDEGTASWREFTPVARPVIEDPVEEPQETDHAVEAMPTPAAQTGEPVEGTAEVFEAAPNPTAEDNPQVDVAPIPAAEESNWTATESEPFETEAGAVEAEPGVPPTAETAITAAESFPVPAPSPIDPKAVEDMVTRVVERMQPQILEVITREVLRPLVEALVRRQLEQK